MKRDLESTKEPFEKLLEWLDPDCEQAAEKYEKIRLRLIRTFVAGGCGDDDEHLTDKTFDVVSQKLEAKEVPEPYIGDKALYFYAVAINIRHEHIRNRGRRALKPPVIPDQDERDEIEKQHACLDECMEKLEQEKRRLAVEYYSFEKTAKIEHRRKLAWELGISVKTLRLRVHRLRVQLLPCIQECLERRQAS